MRFRTKCADRHRRREKARPDALHRFDVVRVDRRLRYELQQVANRDRGPLVHESREPRIGIGPLFGDGVMELLHQRRVPGVIVAVAPETVETGMRQHVVRGGGRLTVPLDTVRGNLFERDRSGERRCVGEALVDERTMQADDFHQSAAVIGGHGADTHF